MARLVKVITGFKEAVQRGRKWLRNSLGLLLISAFSSTVFLCIGELVGTVGECVMSFMAEIAVVVVNTFRSSSNVRLETKRKPKKKC